MEDCNATLECCIERGVVSVLGFLRNNLTMAEAQLRCAASESWGESSMATQGCSDMGHIGSCTRTKGLHVNSNKEGDMGTIEPKYKDPISYEGVKDEAGWRVLDRSTAGEVVS